MGAEGSLPHPQRGATVLLHSSARHGRGHHGVAPCAGTRQRRPAQACGFTSRGFTSSTCKGRRFLPASSAWRAAVRGSQSRELLQQKPACVPLWVAGAPPFRLGQTRSPLGSGSVAGLAGSRPSPRSAGFALQGTVPSAPGCAAAPRCSPAHGAPAALPARGMLRPPRARSPGYGVTAPRCSAAPTAQGAPAPSPAPPRPAMAGGVRGLPLRPPGTTEICPWSAAPRAPRGAAGGARGGVLLPWCGGGSGRPALGGCGEQRAAPPRGARRGLALAVVRERVCFNSRAKQRRLRARLSPAVFSRFPGCPACRSLPRTRPLGSSSSALVPGSRFSRSVCSLPRTYNGTGNLRLLLVLSQ